MSRFAATTEVSTRYHLEDMRKIAGVVPREPTIDMADMMQRMQSKST